MTRKKTTLYVDPDLWQKMKVKAAIENETVTDLLHELMEKETKKLRLKK